MIVSCMLPPIRDSARWNNVHELWQDIQQNYCKIKGIQIWKPALEMLWPYSGIYSAFFFTKHYILVSKGTNMKVLELYVHFWYWTNWWTKQAAITNRDLQKLTAHCAWLHKWKWLEHRDTGKPHLGTRYKGQHITIYPLSMFHNKDNKSFNYTHATILSASSKLYIKQSKHQMVYECTETKVYIENM